MVYGEALGRAISAKVFPHLKELRCGKIKGMGDEGWLAIMKGLEEGGCTELQILDMSHNTMSRTVATALIRALSSGLCRHLEDFDLSDSFDGDESTQLVLQSIKNISFPSVRKFNLGKIRTKADHSTLLGEALKAGAFPKLELLWFSDHSIHHSLWEGLESGKCRELRELFLQFVHLDSDSSTALASAVASGSLSKLQDFCFGETGGGDAGNTNLVEVLSALASSCPDLRHLDVSGGFRSPATR